MKLNSIQQQNFRGSITDKLAHTVVDHPKLLTGITALAGCSVVSQKLVMSSAEATIGPAVDIGVGKAITAITKEKDGRTNQSARVQAARTLAQTAGGTFVGIIIRVACIAGAALLCSKLGEKTGNAVADILNESGKLKAGSFQYKEKMAAWGKNIGGAAATMVMMVTNFIIDAPLINWINKKISPLFGIKIEKQKNAKEVK